ncbi:MAG: hypothetical protein NVS3B28_29630 [Candidatus Velthaea sp.]
MRRTEAAGFRYDPQRRADRARAWSGLSRESDAARVLFLVGSRTATTREQIADFGARATVEIPVLMGERWAI